MFEAKVNGDQDFKIEWKGDRVFLNGEEKQPDIVKTGERSFQVIYEGKSFPVHILEILPEDKVLHLQVNGKKAEVALSSEIDQLLKRLGMANIGVKKVGEVKAPMPGLIHSINVSPGSSVSKGDPILILEAMKMENILKSPTDGIVKSVNVQPGDSVDKGAVLISFE